MTAAIPSQTDASRRHGSVPVLALEIGDYLVECVARPRLLIIGDRVTGVRIYRPLAPSLYTLALALLRRCGEANSQTARIFITLEEALRYAYPQETIAELDVATRRRIGRLVNRLSAALYPYLTLVNIHFNHRCIGYQLALTSDNACSVH